MTQSSPFQRLKSSFQRIFALKVSRSTMREVQNTLLEATGHNQGKASFVLHCLLSGTVQEGPLNQEEQSIVQDLIRDFSASVLLSKDVGERGEFLNIVTTDLVHKPSEGGKGIDFAYLSQLRRIDGEEFRFISDLESTTQLTSHFLSQLQDLQESKEGLTSLKQQRPHLEGIYKQLKKLLKKTESA